MHTTKTLRMIILFSAILWLGIGLVGCATTKSVRDLEAKVQQANDKADKALLAAENAKKVAAAECTAAAQKAESAAIRAEKAAQKAEECAIKCEKIFGKKMMK